MDCVRCGYRFTHQTSSARLPLYFSCCGNSPCLECTVTHHKIQFDRSLPSGQEPYFTCPLCEAPAPLNLAKPLPQRYSFNHGVVRILQQIDGNQVATNQTGLNEVDNCASRVLLPPGQGSCDQVRSSPRSAENLTSESRTVNEELAVASLPPGPGAPTETLDKVVRPAPLHSALHRLLVTPRVTHASITYCEVCCASPATIYCPDCAAAARPSLLCAGTPECVCPTSALSVDEINERAHDNSDLIFIVTSLVRRTPHKFHRPVALRALARDSRLLQSKTNQHSARLGARLDELIKELVNTPKQGEQVKHEADYLCEQLLAAVQQIRLQASSYIDNVVADKLHVTSQTITSLVTILGTLGQISLPVTMSACVGSVEYGYQKLVHNVRLYETLINSVELHDITANLSPVDEKVTLHNISDLIANCRAEWAHFFAHSGQVGSLLAELTRPRSVLPATDPRLGAILARLRQLKHSDPLSFSGYLRPSSAWASSQTIVLPLSLPYLLLVRDAEVTILRCDRVGNDVTLHTTPLSSTSKNSASPTPYGSVNTRGRTFHLVAGANHGSLLLWHKDKVRRISNYKVTRRYHIDNYYQAHNSRQGEKEPAANILQVEDMPALNTILVLTEQGLCAGIKRVAAHASVPLQLVVSLASFPRVFAAGSVPALSSSSVSPYVVVVDHRVLIFAHNCYLFLDMQQHIVNNGRSPLPPPRNLPDYNGAPLCVIKCTIDPNKRLAYFITTDDTVVVCSWAIVEQQCQFIVKVDATYDLQNHCPDIVRAVHYCEFSPTKLYCEIARGSEGRLYSALTILSSNPALARAERKLPSAAATGLQYEPAEYRTDSARAAAPATMPPERNSGVSAAW